MSSCSNDGRELEVFNMRCVLENHKPLSNSGLYDIADCRFDLYLYRCSKAGYGC